MYLGIFIIKLIIYILKIINIKIEKFIKNNEYDNEYNTTIIQSATAISKNTRDILVPDTSTLKILKSSFL